MFRIGEFSKLTQVSIRMLRYYDEIGLLKPKNIDAVTSYRFYSSSQIKDLNKIIFLRDLGFKTSEISYIITNWSENLIISQLNLKKTQILNVIEGEKEKLSKIELAKKDIRSENLDINYNVFIKSVPSYKVLSLKRIVDNYYYEGHLWKEMFDFVIKNKITISDSSNTFAIYHDEEYKEKDVEIEICVPVNNLSANSNDFIFKNTEPVPIMAYTMVYGDFKNIKNSYLSFASWLEEHNTYKIGNHSRQLIHKGPWNEDNVDNYLTEIQIPLIKI